MRKRVALVTGASKGIGAAIAVALEKEGITVLAPPRSEMDMLNISSIEHYLSTVSGPIDILINNAGINDLAGLEELVQDGMTDMLQLNLVAPLMLTKLIAERMKQHLYGRIVNVSSIWSVVAKERRLVYSAVKSAINGVTRTLALELGGHGVLVNAIAPGYVNTELTSKNNSAEQLRQICDNIPLQRLAEPQEIAEMVVFLCSEKNSYMTGQVLVVDGGYVCR
ncbi:SDR family NAD(P)-dependent oxidoreductase [Shewanella vesiculosa]|uniref:SDR family NAD(P)-dependent oxidoreductase n=1 Tax=Shewanella vesiculosa TaxID=518738 RepID=UPI002359A402|nr:SDR family oxidoreductase [Shewanella vesiculosa]NCP72641.1 SDR family oxidoreductase [Shewanella vesiculosa]NCQ43483.1 SDR family oxidoreductase [Shewanella frigidimarina]